MNSVKKNNAGFTLIELLITIVIIAVVAVPFVNSFIQAIQTNAKARKLQNATLAAQDIAEEFKAEPLSKLLDKYTYTTSKGDGQKFDVYTFKDVYIKGTDGEDFYATITLDPNTYVVDEDGNGINGASLPMFSDLYGGDTVVIYKQYIAADNSVKTLFAGVLEESELSSFDVKKAEKVCDVDIKCTEKENGSKYIYEYTITLNVKYIYNGKTSNASRKVITKSYGEDSRHSVYLLAPIFDDDTAVAIDEEGNYYSTDAINIAYEYSGETSRQPKFAFYIAEQNKKNGYDEEKLSRINPSNIKITYDSNESTLASYDSEDKLLKINTNVGKKVDDTVSTGGLTYTDEYLGKMLYYMLIDVRYNKKDGEVLTTFTTAKEE